MNSQEGFTLSEFCLRSRTKSRMLVGLAAILRRGGRGWGADIVVSVACCWAWMCTVCCSIAAGATPPHSLARRTTALTSLAVLHLLCQRWSNLMWGIDTRFCCGGLAVCLFCAFYLLCPQFFSLHGHRGIQLQSALTAMLQGDHEMRCDISQSLKAPVTPPRSCC